MRATFGLQLLKFADSADAVGPPPMTLNSGVLAKQRFVSLREQLGGRPLKTR